MQIEKYRKFLITFAYFAVLALLAFVVLRYALPMLSPFVIGFIIAYALRRPIRFLHRRLSIPHKLAAIVMVLLCYGILGLLLALLGIRAVSWITSFVSTLPWLYQNYAMPFFTEVMANLEQLFRNLDPNVLATLNSISTQALQSVGEALSKLSVTVVGMASGVASALPSFFIKLVLTIISSFFIAMDYDKLRDFCLRQFHDNAKLLIFEIKQYIAGTLWVCIRSYAIIMSITFVELSIGLTVIGIRQAILIALVIAVFDILPVLGTGGIMIPWAVLTAIQGNYPLAIKLLVLYVAITVIRNIIEPKIVGGQLGLHPVVTLASMFVGVQLFGVIGLFGFPILLSLLCYLNDHGVIHIIK